MWLISYETCVGIIAQVLLTPWSIFLFLDILTLKLRIIIIILENDQPEIILLTAHTTKIKLPLPYCNWRKWNEMFVIVTHDKSTKFE